LKKYSLTFILLTLSFLLRSQNVVGIWQLDTKVLAAGYLDSYQFFRDSSFVYHPSQFDALTRIISIGGKYNIQKDSLIFFVEYIIEITGGQIIRSVMYSDNDSWSIENGVINKVYYKSINKQEATFKYCIEESNEIIYIDDNKYFKVDNDPFRYK
jgi:hypothetical protein